MGLLYLFYMFVAESEVSVDSIVTLGYGLKDRGIGVALPA